MRPVRFLISSGLALLLAGPLWAGPLQDMIDAAPDGAELIPPAGVYQERLVIDHPVVLDGRLGVIIDGGEEGTVVTLSASGATLKNLVIRNSGNLFNKTDAGLRVTGDHNVLRDLVIEENLFGVDVVQANGNIFRRLKIASRELGLQLRGDSVRVWYSNDNVFEDNTLHDARDFVIWYSEGNTIRRNHISHSRYGIHFMYAHSNIVRDNVIADCIVGVFMMYANDITLENNKVLRSWGASGIGIGFKESSGARVVGNDLVGNASGIYLDPSPWDPEHPNVFTNNKIAYNGVGVRFLTDWTGNIFTDNAFLSNFTQVSVSGRGTAMREGWSGNYWDDYAGFDKGDDGVGDVPYEVYNYADQIWMERPYASFFRGGLALATLDFVERLAPFSEPRLLMREEAPRMDIPKQEDTTEDAPKSALEMLNARK